MAFPGSPINGQITVVNNISYTYEAASNAWYRTGETTANAVVTDTATIVSNTASTSTTTGALTVAGGAGITGNVHVGAVYTDSYFYANGTPFSTAGALGYTGSSGDVGFTGSASTTIGYTGSKGADGTIGADGYTGSSGEIGYTGSKGADGTIGVDGYTGSAGEIGYTGSVGVAGSAGDTGFVGSVGFTGSAGPAGFTGSVGLLDWTPITANYTVSNRERLLLNSSTGSFTLTLPTTPATGTYIQLTDGANLATDPVTVERNGSTIENLSSNLILDVPNATFEFIYDGSTWQFTSTSGPRGEVGYTGSVGFMGSAGLMDWVVVNSTHTAVDKQRLIVDTSGGTFVLTLPATPTVGTYIQITDGANLLTTPLTVNRNGSTIEGLATDFVMDVPNATFEFIYDGATWQVTSTVGPRGEIGYTGSTGYTGSVGLLDWAPITGNYTAVNRERLMLNSTAGPFTLTLPATPATGTYIQLTDGANLATHNVTIIRNGSTIENIDQDLALDTPNATFEFIYDGATWQVTSTAGPRGLPGYTGSAGADGVIGYNGSVGFTGSAGPAGDAGYTGSASTAAGYTGSQGDTGLGFRIAKSYVSVAALTADTAPTGIVAGEFAIIETGSVEDADNSRLYLWTGTVYTYVTDLSGAAGITGPAGSAGFTGSTGFTGSVGAQGEVGAAGSQGELGYTGSIGFTGSSGEVGFVGSVGATGSQGELGYTGSTGFTGSAGPQGATGFVGSQGTPGEAAAIGYTGSQGFVGSQGVQGVPGIATSSLTVDTFAGTGSQANFGLSVTPTGINQTLVNIDGVAQLKSSYSLSGSTLTFSEAPANGADIEVTVFVYGTSAFVNRIYAGDGTTANFAVTAGVTVDSIIVSDNGIVQRPVTDYSVTGSTITFVVAPLTGSSIQIREIPAGTPGNAGPAGYTGSASTSGSTAAALAGYSLIFGG
jgi:hypothetical protein